MVDDESSSTLFAGNVGSEIPSAGGTSHDGGRRPVFHEHILQALGSLRQRNARVFGAAVGNARALALSRLRSGGGGQEGGKGLYPCLVQLQCVAELEEAFSVLSLAAGAEGEGGNGVDDAVRGKGESGGRTKRLMTCAIPRSIMLGVCRTRCVLVRQPR